MANELNYKVYMHVFPNNKVYVGITKQSIEARWGKDGDGYKKQRVYSAIQEFGWDNIEHKILYENLSVDEAREKEIELIKQYDAIKNGYNIDEGGGIGSSRWSIIKVEYNGKTYTTEELLQFAKVELTEKDIITRITRGWDINRALTQEKITKGTKYEYNGDYYTSAELVNLSNVKGIKTSHILERLRDGFTVERAITQPLNVKVQPFPTKNVKFLFNNEEYTVDELAQMSNAKGITPEIIYKRIYNGWNVERAVTQDVRQVNDSYEYNGNKYSSKELAKLGIDGVSPQLIRYRIKFGWSVEDAINTPPRQSKKYLLNGKEYTLNELLPLCKFENPTLQTLYSRLNAMGWDVETAISSKQFESKKQYEYNGRRYTISELLNFAKSKNITKSILSKRLLDGDSIEDALSKPTRKDNEIKFEYNNQLYSIKELLQFCEDKNMTQDGLYYRLVKCKWDIEDALKIPCNIKKNSIKK